MGIAAVLIMSSVVGYPVSGSAYLGPWSDPVQILLVDSRVSCGWDSSVFAVGLEGGMAMSHDNGDSWLSDLSFYGEITVEDYVMYMANMSDPYGTEIFFSKSLDNGTTWSPSILVLTLERNNDGAYRIFKFGSTLIIYSYDGVSSGYGHIEMTRSLDGGDTWSPSIVIDPDAHMDDPIASDMVLFGGKLHVAYYNYLDYPFFRQELVVSSSDDLGVTWTERNVVAIGLLPSLKVDGGTMYLSYMGAIGLVGGICFSKSTNGVDWSAPIMVGPMTDFTDPSSIFSMAVADGDVFVSYMVYNSNGGVGETYFVRINHSADDGVTWDDLGNVTGGNGSELDPALLIHAGRLHFTWVDIEGAWGWDGYTKYRHLEMLDEPIPEFSSIILPVFGTMIFVSAFVILRRKTR